ncbi:MAG: hypothetical protein V4608_00540 [Bacteroidota bacterium]
MASSPPKKPINDNWVTPKKDNTKVVKKEIADNTKNLKSGPTVQSCPLNNQPKYNPNNKACNFASLKISKEERNFDLIVNASTPANRRTLEIVAGYDKKPAKTTFLLQGSVGPCPQIHNNKRSFDLASGTYKILQLTENNLEVNLVSNTLMRLTPWTVQKSKFTISTNRCGHSNETATVVVYPDLELDVFIGWDFGETTWQKGENIEVKKGNRKGAAANKRKGIGLLEKTPTNTKEVTKGLAVGGSIKYDGWEYEIEAVFKTTFQTVEKINRLADRVKVALSVIKGYEGNPTSTLSPITLGMIFPVVKLHFGGAWKEQAGKPTVAYEGVIKLGGEPFFGLSFEWNITSTVLKAIPGGGVVDIIKNKLQAGLLDLVLKAKGLIEGEITWIFKYVNNHFDYDRATGKVDAKIPVSAELTAIKGEVNTTFVHASIEYKIGVDCGLRIGVRYENGSIVCSGAFLNLVIWWSGGTEYGFGSQDTKPNKYGGKSKKEITDKHILYKKELDNEKSEKVFFKYDVKANKFV